MAGPVRTQKQVGEKYKGNLNYFNKPHFFRVLRFTCSLLAFVVGIGSIVWFYKHGSDQFYNPGLISQNHASFKNDCGQCHQARQRDFLNLVSPGKVKTAMDDTFHRGISPSTISTFSERLLRG